MKRNPLLKALLSASIFCSLVATATLANAQVAEPETKEVKAEIHHDAEAIKIIEASIKASGGKELLESVVSGHTTGTMSIPMAGLSGTMDVYAAQGGNLYMKIVIPGFGEQLSGLHDGVGWSIDPMNGPTLTAEDMLTDLIDQSDPQVALNYETRYTTIKYAGETEFNGTPVHQIDYISAANGNESTEYYSIETGLLAGSEATTNSEMGPINAISTIGEYGVFGGLTLATKITQKVGPMNIIIAIDTYEINSVDMSIFDHPPVIKSLIEASKEDTMDDDG